VATPPAWPIPLSIAEKIALGELVAIQGQIEHMMRLALDYSTYGGNKERKNGGEPIYPYVSIRSAPLGSAVKAWIATLRKRLKSKDLLATAEALAPRIAAHVETRNAFIHGAYAHIPYDGDRPSGILFDIREEMRGVEYPVMAFRAKDWELRPVAGIAVAREEAALLSADIRLFKDEIMSADHH
jgi:hypothetical protein